jgi:hypothetical protein
MVSSQEEQVEQQDAIMSAFEATLAAERPAFARGAGDCHGRRAH